MKLQSKALKVTLVIDAVALAGATVPEGQSRVVLEISPAGYDRVVKADIAAKALRRAVAAVAEHGPDGVAVMLQGRLGPGTRCSMPD